MAEETKEELDRFSVFMQKNLHLTIQEARRRFALKKKPTKQTQSLSLTQSTVGIASSIRCQCPRGHKWETRRDRVEWGDELFHARANWNYAINVQLIMAMQEIGGGGSETDVLLSFLNLPNGHAFKKHTFHRIEDKLGDTIEKVTQQSMKDALSEEIRLQLIEDGREGDLKKWQAGKKINRVFLTVLYDMGWSKQSSGTRYDSKSGHAFLVGALSKKK